MLSFLQVGMVMAGKKAIEAVAEETGGMESYGKKFAVGLVIGLVISAILIIAVVAVFSSFIK